MRLRRFEQGLNYANDNGDVAKIDALAEAYGVVPSAVSLVRGLRSRHKRFAIHRPEKPKERGKT